MYIAFIKTRRKTRRGSRYILRESCRLNGNLTFRDLFDLGPDPSAFIKYVGTNAFYFDEDMEEAVSQSASNYDSDVLEDIFWPWVKPSVRRAVDTFRNRSSNTGYKKLNTSQKDRIKAQVHYFDKRRTHYLKFGSMDQGPLENMPVALFKNLVDISRDEIEQNFQRQEFLLKEHELKSYVYTVFDLQSFFKSFMAKTMPHAMDQDKVDEYFIKTLCSLNQDLFKAGDDLDSYMTRYALMFFDHAYADSTMLDDFAKNFMFRHRKFKPPAKKNIPEETALKIFKLTRSEFKAITKRGLRKLYRRLARKVHPDTGGSHEKFVELNNAYESLLDRIKGAAKI
jgi:hypothetical protein